jgi:hypothetical protein
MNKNKQKKGYDAVKALSVKSTASEFNCTEAYVRMCIVGTANYGRADEIKKYYQKKYNEVTVTLKN